MYVNDPSGFSVSVPCAGPASTTAARLSPTTWASLPSTPGAPIVSATFFVALYASFSATGRAATSTTAIVTDTVVLSSVPSVAWYVKLSTPVNPGPGV